MSRIDKAEVHKWLQGGGRRGDGTLGDIYCGVCGYTLTANLIRAIAKKHGQKTSVLLGGGIVRGWSTHWTNGIAIKRHPSGEFYMVWCEGHQAPDAVLRAISEDLKQKEVSSRIIIDAVGDYVLHVPGKVG